MMPSGALGQAPSLVVRAMSVSDLSEVLAIEQSIYEFPWPRKAFEHCVRRGYHCALVCEDGLCENGLCEDGVCEGGQSDYWQEEQVCGYAIMDMLPGRAHICNVSVKETRQGQGIGRFLMRGLLGFASQKGAAHAYLEVRPSNYAARAFYERLGFQQAGVRRDYYRARIGVEDAYVYRRATGLAENTL